MGEAQNASKEERQRHDGEQEGLRRKVRKGANGVITPGEEPHGDCGELLSDWRLRVGGGMLFLNYFLGQLTFCLIKCRGKKYICIIYNIL